MKNFLLIISFFSFIHSSRALNIQQIIVTPINGNDINIHLKVADGYRFDYRSHDFNINNNEIILNVCYNPYLVPLVTYKENDFVIPNINISVANIQLTINVSCWTYINNIVVCNGVIGLDTEIVTFNTPVNNAVYLAINKNEFNVFSIYPNPSNGLVFIQLSSDTDVKVRLNDISGRLIFDEIFENNELTFKKDVRFDNLSKGIYLINVESGGKIASKKLVIE